MGLEEGAGASRQQGRAFQAGGTACVQGAGVPGMTGPAPQEDPWEHLSGSAPALKPATGQRPAVQDPAGFISKTASGAESLLHLCPSCDQPQLGPS